jgi:hypothetical protein
MILRYVGNGNFIIGVPARDLTAVEAEQNGGVDALTATRLYVRDEQIGEPIQLIEDVTLSGVIDLTDGVDDSEAKLAGRALRKRRTKHG